MMNVEMEQVRSRLVQAEKRAREPSPQVLELQAKMAAMKVSAACERRDGVVGGGMEVWIVGGGTEMWIVGGGTEVWHVGGGVACGKR